MKDRIRAVRDKTGLSQAKFGEKIGVSRDTVANIEAGRIEIKDIFIKSICKEFFVNEEWLRNGIGKMFVEKTKDEQIAEILSGIQRDGEDSFKHRLISALSKLDEQDWIALEKLIDLISDN